MIFPDNSLEKIFIEHLTSGNDRHSFENEWREAPDIMRKISRENDDFRLENISSDDVPYAFRIIQGALWRPHEMF